MEGGRSQKRGEMAGERRQASQHPKQQQVASDLPSQEAGVCLDGHLSGGKKAELTSFYLEFPQTLLQRQPPWFRGQSWGWGGHLGDFLPQIYVGHKAAGPPAGWSLSAPARKPI